MTFEKKIYKHKIKIQHNLELNGARTQRFRAIKKDNQIMVATHTELHTYALCACLAHVYTIQCRCACGLTLLPVHMYW